MRFGTQGRPLIYFPTSGGHADEWQGYGFDREIAPWIASGRLQLFSIDARGPQTLFDDRLSPGDRLAAYAETERALLAWLKELGRQTEEQPFDLLGASYGAFVAVNLFCKQPGSVRHVTGFGGVYEMWHRLHRRPDPGSAPYTPLAYLAEWKEGAHLTRLRKTEGLRLFAARGDEWFAETPALAEILTRLRIPASVELWSREHRHHESTWLLQLRKHLVQRYGV